MSKRTWILIIVVAAVVGYCTSQAVNSNPPGFRTTRNV